MRTFLPPEVELLTPPCVQLAWLSRHKWGSMWIRAVERPCVDHSHSHDNTAVTLLYLCRGKAAGGIGCCVAWKTVKLVRCCRFALCMITELSVVSQEYTAGGREDWDGDWLHILISFTSIEQSPLSFPRVFKWYAVVYFNLNRPIIGQGCSLGSVIGFYSHQCWELNVACCLKIDRKKKEKEDSGDGKRCYWFHTFEAHRSQLSLGWIEIYHIEWPIGVTINTFSVLSHIPNPFDLLIWSLFPCLIGKSWLDSHSEKPSRELHPCQQIW